MIKVVARMTIKEGMAEILKGAVVELVEETRKEEGCIAYQLFQDIGNENIFTFMEEWEDQEALQKHMKSPHFQAAMPKLSALQEKDMEVNIYGLVI